MRIHGIYFVAATLAALTLASGCGSSGSSTTKSSDISVEAGSLSKAEFIKRADAICEGARKQFDREYAIFLKQKLSKGANENALQAELVDTILIPSYGKDVEEISALGAPNGDERRVTSFLKALQKRLEELHEKPSELSNEMFDAPAKLATAYGLDGCVKSLIG